MNQSIRKRNRGRLQRDPDFTGERISTFTAVFYRHGLPCVLLALVFLLDPRLRVALQNSLSSLLQTSVPYMLGVFGIFTALLMHSAIQRKKAGRGTVEPRYIGWIVYLGLLSIWEEWVFRLGLPFYLQLAGLSLVGSVLVSNVAFGAMHYFTLRWKWYWCVIAGLGGLGFSHHFQTHGNLAVIAGIHWVATYFNTPVPPSDKTSDERDMTGHSD